MNKELERARLEEWWRKEDERRRESNRRLLLSRLIAGISIWLAVAAGSLLMLALVGCAGNGKAPAAFPGNAVNVEKLRGNTERLLWVEFNGCRPSEPQVRSQIKEFEELLPATAPHVDGIIVTTTPGCAGVHLWLSRWAPSLRIIGGLKTVGLFARPGLPPLAFSDPDAWQRIAESVLSIVRKTWRPGDESVLFVLEHESAVRITRWQKIDPKALAKAIRKLPLTVDVLVPDTGEITTVRVIYLVDGAGPGDAVQELVWDAHQQALGDQVYAIDGTMGYCGKVDGRAADAMWRRRVNREVSNWPPIPLLFENGVSPPYWPLAGQTDRVLQLYDQKMHARPRWVISYPGLKNWHAWCSARAAQNAPINDEPDGGAYGPGFPEQRPLSSGMDAQGGDGLPDLWGPCSSPSLPSPNSGSDDLMTTQGRRRPREELLATNPNNGALVEGRDDQPFMTPTIQAARQVVSGQPAYRHAGDTEHGGLGVFSSSPVSPAPDSGGAGRVAEALSPSLQSAPPASPLSAVGPPAPYDVLTPQVCVRDDYPRSVPECHGLWLVRDPANCQPPWTLAEPVNPLVSRQAYHFAPYAAHFLDWGGCEFILGDVFPDGGDGVVDVDDLNRITEAYSQSGLGCTRVDVCQNGVVDHEDILCVVGAFQGECHCP